jgi:hypothetical protein
MLEYTTLARLVRLKPDATEVHDGRGALKPDTTDFDDRLAALI